MNTRDQPWIDLLMTVGKELGIDLPSPPARPQRWEPPQPAKPPEVDPAAAARTRLVETSQSVSRDGLADLVEGLAARIREGSVSVSAGAYSVHVDVPDDVSVDLSITSREGSGGTDLELGIAVQWRAPNPADSDDVPLE